MGRLASAAGRAALAAALVVSGAAALGTAASADDPPVSERQQAFEAAAAEYGVPVSVLLGVSYLESRWDANGGQPSTAGGYGPMHLTDAAAFLAGGTEFDHGFGQQLPGEDPVAAEDARGDDERPMQLSQPAEEPGSLPEALRTVATAAELTGVNAAQLKSDPAQNVRGGAALLAAYQRQLGAPSSADAAGWYGAVARYGGSTDAAAAAQFADEVYAQIQTGADRVTDDGQRVVLAPTAVAPDRSWLDRLGLPGGDPTNPDVECPAGLGCEWVPAPYQSLGPNPGSYGNHDLGQRPSTQQIRYIVIHDTEGSYAGTLRLVQYPTYVSWQYTIRSSDGHVAQHVHSNDVAWQAGNWYVNATSIGIEHEGFAALGTWYTETMYRHSARLVRYLALRFGIPMDRDHIIGHDNVPGITPANVRGMHWDPGPYWNWVHYFELMGAPLHPADAQHTQLVTMTPDWETNMPAFLGCTGAATNPCPLRSSSSVILRSAPSASAPLVVDVGLHPNGAPSTMFISDHGARAAAGQTYAVAEVRGDWTAIWYLGQKAWFLNPPGAPTAVRAAGLMVTPKAGLASIPVYGRAYPEPAAYPPNIPVQAIVPLQYTLHAGERYAVGQLVPSEYYRAVTFNCSGAGDCTVVRGQLRYYQIQFGHRIMFVKEGDVDTLPD